MPTGMSTCACGKSFVPGVGGAAKGKCATCYRRAHRGGSEKGREAVLGANRPLTVYVSQDLAQWVEMRGGMLGASAFVRMVLEQRRVMEEENARLGRE